METPVKLLKYAVEPWEIIARELGDFELVDEGSSYNTYRTMGQVNDPYYVGDWVDAEKACREIVRLRDELAELQAQYKADEDAWTLFFSGKGK